MSSYLHPLAYRTIHWDLYVLCDLTNHIVHIGSSRPSCMALVRAGWWQWHLAPSPARDNNENNESNEKQAKNNEKSIRDNENNELRPGHLLPGRTGHVESGTSCWKKYVLCDLSNHIVHKGPNVWFYTLVAGGH